jgi:predicted nucleic acid-binding protein
MRVLVDSTVWSHVLRRKTRPENAELSMQLATLLADRLVAIIGPIRQEVLSGIKENAYFEQLREELRAFLDIEITVDDYETAAAFYNACRSRGIQGSATDFLICAVAVRHDLAIFTTDADFAHYAKVLPITLYAPAR